MNQSVSQSAGIKHLWDARADLVRSCVSVQGLLTCLRQIPGFRGGKGFMAQEIVQDVRLTSWGMDFPDANEFCAVRPGARRGLNRLHGRSTAFGGSGVYDQHGFLEECLEIYHLLQHNMTSWCEERDLSLHDVQFSLCEFDKYERIRLNEKGKRRKYQRSLSTYEL